jgi:hypothetical protein
MTALLPVLIALVAAAQLTGSLQLIALMVGLALGGVAYLMMSIIIELVRLITATLLPSSLD